MPALPQVPVTKTEYDAADNVRTVTDAAGTITSFGYDPYNRRTMVIEAFGKPEQRTSTTEYDAAGNVIRERRGASADPDQNLVVETSYRYDALNRRTQVIAGTNYTAAQLQAKVGHGYPTTTISYNSLDLVRSVEVDVSWDGRAATSRTDYSYDDLLRQTLVLEGANDPKAQRVSESRYDVLGNLISSTDAQGLQTSYVYDNLNRLQVTIQGSNLPAPLPQGQHDTTERQIRTTLVYDAFGAVVQQQTQLGTTRSYYDRLGRLNLTV
jgi:YD repeat-containing protein